MTQLPTVSSVDYDVRDVDTKEDDLVTKFMTSDWMLTVQWQRVLHPVHQWACRKHKDAVLNSPIMNWIWSFGQLQAFSTSEDQHSTASIKWGRNYCSVYLELDEFLCFTLQKDHRHQRVASFALYIAWARCLLCERESRYKQTRIQLFKSSWMPDGSDLPSIIQPKGCLLNDSGICMIKSALSSQRMTGILLAPFQQFPNQSAGKQPLILEMPSQSVTALQQSVLGSVEPAKKTGHNSRSCPNKEI